MLLLRATDSHPVKRILSSPVFLASLLLALTAYPPPALVALFNQLPSAITLGRVKALLQIFVVLGFLGCINGTLSCMAENSWRMTSATLWNWPDEIAVVTGGASGIGLGVVERLVSQRVKVAILDIRDVPKPLQDNPYIFFYSCDITSPESVAQAADAVRREIGNPSILINNAGITQPESILKMPHDFLRKIFDVNCLSHWTLVQQFLPHMIQANKGHIITVASIASFVALTKGADYSATKAAAMAFHESLTMELRHMYKSDGVLTSIAHPNFVRTPLVKKFADGLEKGGVKLLTIDQVADDIAGQVFSKRGGQLVIPRRLALLSGMRGWPTWLQTLIRDKAGKLAVSN